jgi:hypothetical protein
VNIGIGKFLRDGMTQAGIESAFRRVTAAISAGFLREHKEDGTHSDVSLTTLTVEDGGAVIAMGDLPLASGGTTERWGINAAGDFTFGPSAHIADSSGTPVIGSGWGTSPSVAGTDYAFIIDVGSAPPSIGAGNVTFGHTFASPPVCVVSPAGTHTGEVWSVTTTTSTATFAASTTPSAGATIHVICRGY